VSAINILNMSGKHPDVPMRPRGAPVKMARVESGDPQKAALAASARADMPVSRPGGKVNMLA